MQYKLEKTWLRCKNASKKVLKIYAFSLSEIATQRIFKTLNGENKRLGMRDKTSYERNKKFEKKYLSICSDYNKNYLPTTCSWIWNSTIRTGTGCTRKLCCLTKFLKNDQKTSLKDRIH